MDCNKIWTDLQDAIKEAIPTEVSYNVFIRPAKAVDFKNSVFTISVPSSITKNMIDIRFKSKIEGIIEAYTGQKITLKVILESDATEFFDYPHIETEEDEMTSDLSSIPLNEKFTFESFVVGSSNQYAAATAIAASENPGKIYNPIFLYGKSGLGKTHLMCALGNKIKKEHPEMKIVYTTTENFTNDFVDCIKKNKMSLFKKKYRNIDVLLVDDVQFLEKREGFQEEFFFTFNDLQSRNKQIVITCDKRPNELKNIEDRIISRFNTLPIDIAVPDYDTRLAILKKKKEENRYDISDNILEFIAERIKSNVRELEGALLKVVSFAQLSHKEIDLDLTNYVINSILPQNGLVKMTPDRIMEKVSAFYNVTKEDILGKSQVQSIVLPRQVAMYLCSELSDMNNSAIARAFGNKDRTTVLHSIDKIKKCRETDPVMRTNIEYIMKDLDM